ncbi:MAG: serine protease [Candidatus Woesearchaeota archaeon]
MHSKNKNIKFNNPLKKHKFLSFFTILFLLTAACNQGISEVEVQSQIEKAVDKATKQAQSENNLLEETIKNLEKKIEELNEIVNESSKTKFFTWGTEYFKSIVDIGYFDADDNYVGLGSGAIISSDGYVITNYHVAVGIQDFAFFGYSEYDPKLQKWIDPDTKEEIEPLSAEWVSGSMCYDIALLKINSEKEFLKLDWYGDFEPGLEVFTLGYPSVGQGEITVSNGVVSSLRYFGDTRWTAPGFNTFGHTSPIFFGNSGSPVLSEDGKIVGINYTAYQEQDEEFSISYAIDNQIIQQIVDDYLIHGNNHLSIGLDGNADNLWFYLDDEDERNLPFYYVNSIHPGSIAENAQIESNELLFFFGDYYVGQNDFSDFGVDGAPMLSDLCSLIRNWEESINDTIELTLYSCQFESFYIATLSKSNQIEANWIETPFTEFTNEEINLACEGTN